MEEESKKYRKVSVLGANCYTDAYIYDVNERAYLLSLFGRPGIVKAVTASFITSGSVYIEKDERDSLSLSRAHSKYRIFTHNNNGLCHKVILSPDCFQGDQNRIIAENDTDRIFHFVDSSISTPLKREWINWLLQRNVICSDEIYGFGQIGGINTEECRLFHAPYSESVDDVVLEGIKNGELI